MGAGDVHLFVPFKKHLTGKQLATYADMKQLLRQFCCFIAYFDRQLTVFTSKLY
jgi:hypothetical protein